jgi:hypothetical protein
MSCNNIPIFNECPDMPERYALPSNDAYNTYCVLEEDVTANPNIFWDGNTYISVFFTADNAQQTGIQTIVSIDTGGWCSLYLDNGYPVARIEFANPQNLKDEKTDTIHKEVTQIELRGDAQLNDDTLYHFGLFVNNVGGKIFFIINDDIVHTWSSLNVDFSLGKIKIGSGTGYIGVGDDITQRGLNDTEVTPLTGNIKHVRLIGSRDAVDYENPDSWTELFQTSEALNLSLERNICVST